MKIIKTKNYIKLAQTSMMPITQTTTIKFSILPDGQLMYDPQGKASNRPHRDNWFSVEVSFEGRYHPSPSGEDVPSLAEYGDNTVIKASHILERYGIVIGNPFPEDILEPGQWEEIFDKMEEEARINEEIF